MKTQHKIIYQLMNFGAVAVLIIPSMIAINSELDVIWKALICLFFWFQYHGLTGVFGPISLYRESKELEFESFNREKIEPYF